MSNERKPWRKALVESVDRDKLLAYLERAGWLHFADELRDGAFCAAVYRMPCGLDDYFYVVVPDRRFRDYHVRISEVLSTLEVAENRGPEAIVADIMEIEAFYAKVIESVADRADAIKYRALTATPDACHRCQQDMTLAADGLAWRCDRCGVKRALMKELPTLPEAALPVACSRCRRSAITVYPAAVVEAVPQADPAHGVEPCGCAHRGPYRHEIERYAHNAVAYTELRYDRGCTFCRGTGNVRDGRREGEHDYAASSTAIMRVPHTVAAELEHRREQPDAFGHPWLCRLHLHLARAPLAELLHGEADGR